MVYLISFAIVKIMLACYAKDTTFVNNRSVHILFCNFVSKIFPKISNL